MSISCFRIRLSLRRETWSFVLRPAERRYFISAMALPTDAGNSWRTQGPPEHLIRAIDAVLWAVGSRPNPVKMILGGGLVDDADPIEPLPKNSTRESVRSLPRRYEDWFPEILHRR